MTALISGDRRVPWLDVFPNDWQVTPLKFVTAVNREVLSESTPEDQEIRYIDISSVNSLGEVVNAEAMPFGSAPSRARRLVRHGDTIVSTVRTYLRAVAAIPEEDWALIASTGFAVISPRTETEPGFLSYWLRSDNFIDEVCARSVGVSYPATNSSELGCIPAPLPPLSVQRAIADFLDRKTAAIDALIEKKERLLTLLAEKRAAMIHQAVTKGLDPNVPMKDSGIPWIGEIPAHWAVVPLKRLVSTRVTDGPHETPEFIDAGVPFVSANAVQGGRILLDLRRGDISPEDHEKYCRKCRPQRDDIFIVKSGATTGKIGIVETNEEFSVWSPLALVRCAPGKALPRFVFQALMSPSFQRQVQTSWSYGTQPNIGMGTLENLYVALPPLPEQRAIAETVGKHGGSEERVEQLARAAVDRLREYRQALITAAVTGQLDIEEAA